MIAIAWQFEVKNGREAEFEELYGADGEWTALNRRTRSYLGSSFLRDQSRTSRYLVIEYWSEMLVYERHLADFNTDLHQLEEQRQHFVVRMEALGVFSALDTPDRVGPTWSRRSG